VPAATGGRTPVSGGPAPRPAGAVGEGLGGVKRKSFLTNV
jgi:hypothetical protein